MTIAPLQQRCTNHVGREAVCRCPSCSLAFCRECVTEHDARLLCSACVARLQPTAAARNPALLPPLILLSSLVLAWASFYGYAQGISQLSAVWELRQ